MGKIASSAWSATWVPSSACGVQCRSAQRELSVAVLPGDGIGPEITGVTLRVLEAAMTATHADTSTQLLLEEAPFGGAGIDSRESTPLPQSTLDLCLRSD